MNRRQFFGGALMAGAAAATSRTAKGGSAVAACDCVPAVPTALPAAPGKIRITGAKTFGVTWEEDSDRPYVFVKLETD